MEQAHTRFIGYFEELYCNPNKSLNLIIQNIIKKCKQIIIDKRNLYIYYQDENYINVIWIYKNYLLL